MYYCNQMYQTQRLRLISIALFSEWYSPGENCHNACRRKPIILPVLRKQCMEYFI